MKYKRKQAMSDEPKYKKKSGYRLKRGASGEMRWHKDDAYVASKYRRKSSKNQASLKLEQYYDEASELNAQQFPGADRLLTRAINANTNSSIQRASLDSEWLVDNSFGSGGISSPQATGIRGALLDFRRKEKEVKAANTQFDKFTVAFNNTDRELTPDLEDVYYALKVEQSSNSELFREYRNELSGNSYGVRTASVGDEDIERITAARILDRSQVIQGRDDYNIDNDGFYFDQPRVPIAGVRMDQTTRELSLRNLANTFMNGEQRALREMAHRYGYYTDYTDQPDPSKYDNRTNSFGVITSASNYADDIEKIRTQMKEIAKMEPDLAKSLDLINVEAMGRKKERQIEMAAASRLFGRLMANKFIKSLDLRDTRAGTPRPYEGAEFLIKRLQDTYNDNSKITIHADPEIMPNLHPGRKTWANAEMRLESNYVSDIGKINLALDSTNSTGRVADRLLPGYSSIPLHESLHAVDYFTNTVATALSLQQTSQTARNLDFNGGSVSHQPEVIEFLSDPKFISDIGVEVGKPSVPRKRILYRRNLTKMIAEVAGSMMNRNEDEKSYYKQESNKDKWRQAGDTLVDLHVSPLFLIPEFARLAYVLSANKGKEKASVKNNFNVISEHNKTAQAHSHNPETITVLTEYAIGSPHVLEAIDEIYGTKLRESINRYHGYSIVQKSDPVLLANARINLLAAKENPGSIYKGVTERTKKDMNSYGVTPYQSKIYIPDVVVQNKYRRKA